MNKYKNIISKFKDKKLLVVGDIMLDRHIVGSVSRISPEAPVPVVLEEQRFETLGGAANVGSNLSALGARAVQVGVIGDDLEGKILKEKMEERGIDTSGVLVDKNFRTVTKTRIIARHQQVVRIDREVMEPSGDRGLVKDFILNNIGNVEAVIISDYGKGLIGADLIHAVCSRARRQNVKVIVDPKVEHFKYYRQVTSITPNKRETENAIRNLKVQHNAGRKLDISNDRLDTDDEINKAGQEILKYLELESLLITLGEHGMRLFEKGKKPCHIPTHARDVFDVTGAGDAVISVFTLSLVAGATKKEAAQLANYAAGIVVGRLGAVAVTARELLDAARET